MQQPMRVPALETGSQFEFDKFDMAIAEAAAGDPDGTRTDCPQAAHLIRQPTVRVSSFSHHRPAVMVHHEMIDSGPRRPKKPRRGGAAALREGAEGARTSNSNLLRAPGDRWW